MGSQARWEDAAVAQLLASFPLTLVLCLSMHIGTTQATLHLHFFESFLHVARVEHRALALVPPPRPPGAHSSSPQAQSTAESLLTKNSIPAPQGGKQIVASLQSLTLHRTGQVHI